MSDLPIAVSERVGRRARLPPLQVVVILAKRCLEVRASRSNGHARRACDWRRSKRTVAGTPGKSKNMKENDERVCHVFWR